MPSDSSGLGRVKTITQDEHLDLVGAPLQPCEKKPEELLDYFGHLFSHGLPHIHIISNHLSPDPFQRPGRRAFPRSPLDQSGVLTRQGGVGSASPELLGQRHRPPRRGGGGDGHGAAGGDPRRGAPLTRFKRVKSWEEKGEKAW